MPQKILCAIDNTEHARPAISLAIELARRLPAALTFCTVNVLTGGIHGPSFYLHSDEDMEHVVGRAAGLAAEAGVETAKTVVLKARDVAIAIVQHADQNGFDHVVTGTGSKGSLTRFALGSVATDIVHRAHCPVTVAR